MATACPGCGAPVQSSEESAAQEDGGGHGHVLPEANRRAQLTAFVVSLLVLILVVAGTWTYYAKFSDAQKSIVRVPVGAKDSDVTKILRQKGSTRTVGEIRYVTYRFNDLSRLICTYGPEQETRERGVLKSFEVQKYRKEYQKVGWDFYLNMPDYDYVTVPYTDRETKFVKESYQATVWKVRSVRAEFDLRAAKSMVGM